MDTGASAGRRCITVVVSVTGEHVPYIVDSVGSVGTCAALRAGF